MASNHRRIPAGFLLFWLMAGGLAVSGCTYVCHDYVPFEEAVEQGRWRVKGNVERFRPEGWESGPGSWHHWRADKNDRYQLTLIPVAADPSWWADGSVDVRNVRVVAGPRTIAIRWAEVTDLVEKHRDRVDHQGNPRPYNLEYGRLEFTSEFFRIAPPLPDTLRVDYDLIFRNAADGSFRSQRAISSRAVIDRHRRWDVVDMAES